MTTTIIRPLAALTLLLSIGADDPRDIVIEVDAGGHARQDTLVQFALPERRRDAFRFSTLEDLASKSLIPGQRQDEVIYWILRDPLPAGTKRRYRLSPQPRPGEGQPQSPTLIAATPVAVKSAGNLQFNGVRDFVQLKMRHDQWFALDPRRHVLAERSEST